MANEEKTVPSNKPPLKPPPVTAPPPKNTPYTQLVKTHSDALSGHPTFFGSNLKLFTHRPTNNVNFMATFPDGRQAIVKSMLSGEVKSEEGTAGRAASLVPPSLRLHNINFLHDVANTLGIQNTKTRTLHPLNDRYFPKNLHGVVVSDYDPSLEHLAHNPDPHARLNSVPLYDILKHHLFERLGVEDQHLGNVSLKNNKPVLVDAEYLYNPTQGEWAVYHSIENSALAKYLKNHLGEIVKPSLLKEFTDKKEKILDLLDKHIAPHYNKGDDYNAIREHILTTLGIYQQLQKSKKPVTVRQLLNTLDSHKIDMINKYGDSIVLSKPVEGTTSK